MIALMVLMFWIAKAYKTNSREQKMKMTTEKSVLGQMPAARAAAAPTTSTHTLASGMLAAGVAALVVLADHLIDDWADTHVLAAWLALWAVAVIAIASLRGVSRMLAHSLMTRLDAWSAHVATQRSDRRLWAMAQQDPRMMSDLKAAFDRDDGQDGPAKDVLVLSQRRAVRMVRNGLYYI